MDIKLRRANPADAGALYRIYSSPKIVANTLIHAYLELETLSRYLSQPFDGVQLVAQVGDEVIGHAELKLHRSNFRRSHAAEFTIAVREDRHRLGIGRALLQECLTVADNWLHVLRIELLVWPDNASAISLYEAHGFTVEGRLRGYALRNGRFSDILTMARLHPAPPGIDLGT